MKKKTDAEVLAQVLSLPKSRVAGIAQRLDAIGGLSGLWHAGSEGLCDLIDYKQAIRLDSILHLTNRMLLPGSPPERIEDPASVVSYLSPRIGHLREESFWMVALDARGRPIGVDCVARGTLTACLVHPREVFASAIRARAAAVIVVHNHPSGDPDPSDEDHILTERLAEAGAILGIPLLDHIIVTGRAFRSLGPMTKSSASPQGTEPCEVALHD